MTLPSHMCVVGSEDAAGIDSTPEPEIIIEPRPKIYQTDLGDMDEANAAAYLSWRMRKEVSARTLRDWRNKRVGPVFHAGPFGRPIWYRLGDLDEWLELTTAADPLAA